MDEEQCMEETNTYKEYYIYSKYYYEREREREMNQNQHKLF